MLKPSDLKKKKNTSSLYYFDKRSTFEAPFVKLNQQFICLSYNSNIPHVCSKCTF